MGNPVAFVGSERAWPRGGVPRPRVPRPTVTVRLGSPLKMEGSNDQANTDRFMKHLGDMVLDLQSR